MSSDTWLYTKEPSVQTKDIETRQDGKPEGSEKMLFCEEGIEIIRTGKKSQKTQFRKSKFT